MEYEIPQQDSRNKVFGDESPVNELPFISENELIKINANM